MEKWYDNQDHLFGKLEIMGIEEIEKTAVLVILLGLSSEEARNICWQDSCAADMGLTRYLVCTQSEVDDLVEERLLCKLEYEVLQYIPAGLRKYFDRQKWLEDAKEEYTAAELLAIDKIERSLVFDNMTYKVYLNHGE